VPGVSALPASIAALPGTTAHKLLRELTARRSDEQRRRYERSLSSGPQDEFLGVRMGDVFALAKDFRGLPLDEIERLLESPVHEARVAALSVMDLQARSKRTSPDRREQLFDLYLRRTDRIDSWDLVDRGCVNVVGGYLFDKPREPLFRLARSSNPWERRTAIVSTLYFIRRDDAEDSFRVAAILRRDSHDLVQKATGGVLREAGKKDTDGLVSFLEEHAAEMPPVMLRYAIERLEPEQRAHFRERGRRPRPADRGAGPSRRTR
jgi:3-methyladenine DNA glycosylase AlkD